MEELKINFKLEFSDFLDFQFSHLRRSFLNKLLLVGLTIVVLPFAAIFLLKGSIGLPALTIYGKPAAIFFSVLVLMLLAIWFSAKKAFSNDREIQMNSEYVFDASGILRSSESSTIRFSWSDLYKFAESGKTLFIYSAPAKAYIIPKRHLTQEQLAFIKSFLNASIAVRPKKDPFRFSWPLRIAFFVVPLAVGILTALHKSDSEKHFESGYSNEQNGNYESALADFTKAIEEDPSYIKAYTHRGFVKGMLEDYKGGLEDYNMAIALDKDNGQAFYGRALARYDLGDSTGCCNDLHTSLSLGFKDAKETIKEYCN